MPDIASIFVFPLFLLFIRVGSAVMLFPGFSDTTVSARLRLLVALWISLVMFPALMDKLPQLPASGAEFFMYMGVEFMIGILYAITGKIFLTALNVAGELIAFASGFQAATLFDPESGANTIAPAVLLLTIAVLLIFVTGMHHVMIEGILTSYEVFPPGELPPIGDSVLAIARTVGDLFKTGVMVASPVMVVGFLGYVGFGIFNRLIPQLHAFFVAIPIILGAGIMMLGISLATMLSLFQQDWFDHRSTFVVEAEV